MSEVPGGSAEQSTDPGWSSPGEALIRPPATNDVPPGVGNPPAPVPAPPASGAQPPSPYGAPPTYGTQPPSYGTPPPAYGTQPPAYGTQPPVYGTQPPSYGTPPGYGTPPPAYGAPSTPVYGAQPTYGAQPSQAPGGQPTYGTQVPSYGAAPSYGAVPSYGQPATYGAPPTYGPAGGYDPYAPPPKANGLAVASLIVGIVGLFCGVGLVGLILGIVALHQIRQGRGTGKGLAIGGIVTGAVGTVWAIIGFAMGLAGAFDDPTTTTSTSTSTSVAGRTADTGVPSDFHLPQGHSAGECFSVWSRTWDMSDADLVSCAQPHGMEIVTTFQLSGAVRSTEDDVMSQAYEDCWAHITTLVPKSAQDVLDDDIFFPSADQWTSGERTAYCVVVPYRDAALKGGSVVAGTYAGTQST